jgi:hypothetical protein
MNDANRYKNVHWHMKIVCDVKHVFCSRTTFFYNIIYQEIYHFLNWAQFPCDFELFPLCETEFSLTDIIAKIH